MTSLKKTNPAILFDLNHNEMLDIEDNNFSDFSDLLHSLGIKINKNENKNLTDKILENIDILIIGNPIDNYFSSIEIKEIINFVREGGRLILISEYGSDYLQKTNLNDITEKNFGIFFHKNIVKEYNEINQNCSSILSIQNFHRTQITNHAIREVIIGGACSLFLNKNSKPLLFSNKAWTEAYSNSAEQWIKEGVEQQHSIAAYTEYGRGKVIAFGDIDIFTNDDNIGLNLRDNRKLILNILNWLMEPVESNDTMAWTLNQIGTLAYEIKEMNNKINNIIETMTILERRISALEDIKYDAKIKNELEEKEISKF
jgi:hypothetical protein